MRVGRAASPGTAGRWPRPRARRRAASPSEVSEDAVETLFATVLLTIATFEQSSSMIAPPRSAAPLSTIKLLRMLIRAW